MTNTKSLKPIESNYISPEEALEQIIKIKVDGKPAEALKKETLLEVASSDLQYPENYLILEGRNDGIFYPDLLVEMRTEHCNVNWDDAHRKLHEENSFMLDIRQYVDFIRLLKSGKAFNAKKERIPQERLEAVIKEIFGMHSPKRGEWLDALFIENEFIYMNTDHRMIDGELKPTTTISLTGTGYLPRKQGERVQGIDLDYWLNNATRTGLPNVFTPEGDFLYYPPIHNFVAKFFVDPYFSPRVACLDCASTLEGVISNIFPTNTGVRAAKILK